VKRKKNFYVSRFNSHNLGGVMKKKWQRFGWLFSFLFLSLIVACGGQSSEPAAGPEAAGPGQAEESGGEAEQAPAEAAPADAVPVAARPQFVEFYADW
jgi:hypothetical protein